MNIHFTYISDILTFFTYKAAVSFAFFIYLTYVITHIVILHLLHLENKKENKTKKTKIEERYHYYYCFLFFSSIFRVSNSSLNCSCLKLAALTSSIFISNFCNSE